MPAVLAIALTAGLLGSSAALQDPGSALAIADGTEATATAYPTGPDVSKIVIARRDAEPEELAIPATVRALMFTAGDRALYAILVRESKRRPPQTWLQAIDMETLDSTRAATLPPSARALTAWERGGAILVACEDELRTFMTPDHRSGPLYRIPGPNRALLVIPDSDLVLVGKDLGVVAVDLRDAHRDNEMPVRASFQTSSPPAALALIDGGATVAARLEDRTVVSTPIETLRVAARTPPPPRAVEPEESAARAAETSEAPPPRAVEPEEPAARAAETPQASPPRVEMPTEAQQPVPAPPTPPPPADAAIAGVVTGAAAGEVEWVVAYGPDNVVREAARVAPEADGTFSFAGLASGRYRVLIVGKGGKVVESRPAFLAVTVGDGEVERRTIEAVRVR